MSKGWTEQDSSTFIQDADCFVPERELLVEWSRASVASSQPGSNPISSLSFAAATARLARQSFPVWKGSAWRRLELSLPDSR